MKTDLWDRDDIQFARLLDEIRAVGLTAEQTAALCDSMDLDARAIEEIFERASDAFESAKCDHASGRLVTLDEPLSIEQIKEQYENDGMVAGVVRVDLNWLLHADFEQFLDMLSDKLTATVLLENIDFAPIGTEDRTILVRVSGDPSSILDMEDRK